MGSICCKTVLSKEQEYDSIVSDPYEVRIYPAVVVAEIQCGDNALMALLQYLGAIGAPQNVKASNTPSAPGKFSVTHERFPFVLPILQQENMLQVMLPKGYGIAEEFPMSCNPDVQIKTIAQRIVAVRRFSGCSSHERCLEKLQKLHKRLVLDNLVNKEIPKALTEEISMKKPTEDGARCDDTEGVVAVEESKASDRLQGRQVGSEDALKWVVARYNSPCTLPVLRRNEVWIELSPAMPAVAALIDKAALLHTEVLPATQAGNRNSRGRRAKEGEEKGEEGNQIEEVEEQKAEEGKEEKKDGDELLADEIAALAAEAQSLVELGEQMDKVRQNES